MKRTFLNIAAIAVAVVSCTKAQVENTPAAEENVVYTIPTSVVADCPQTKAFYGGESGVVAQWEETDQLVTLKGLANSAWPSTKTDNAGALDITTIEGHSAEFRGDVKSSSNAKAFWYFIYSSPATAEMWAKSEWVGIMSGTQSLSNYVKLTIPSNQDGQRWEPVLWGSTDAMLEDEVARTATFSVLNACLAIRLFESDGQTKTTADRITIEPANETAFACGYFEDTCKPTVNEQETQDEDPSMNGTKLVLNASKFHGDTDAVIDTGNITYEPFNGNEYRFSIPAGVNMGDLKINIYKDGQIITRTLPAKAVEAGHMRPVKIALDAAPAVEVSFLSVDATTTYSAAVAGNLEYANTLENRLKAILSASVLVVDGVITECGFIVDGVKEPVDVNSIEGEFFSTTKEYAMGSHTMNAYVTATSIATGKSATVSSDNVTFHITGLPLDDDLGVNKAEIRNHWSSSNFKWANGGSQLGDGGADVMMLADKVIYLPSDIDFKFCCSGSLKKPGSRANPKVTLTVNVGDKEDLRETDNSGTFTDKWSNYDMTLEGTFTVGQIEMLKFVKTGNSAACAVVKKVRIEYR